MDNSDISDKSHKSDKSGKRYKCDKRYNSDILRNSDILHNSDISGHTRTKHFFLIFFTKLLTNESRWTSLISNKASAYTGKRLHKREREKMDNYDEAELFRILEETDISDEKALTITIGRNIGKTPMSDEMWTEFRNRTLRLITGELYANATYQGIWVNSDNVEIHEESAIFYGVTELSELDVLGELHFLRELFFQDAIGYQFGHTGLVERKGTK